MNYLQVFFRNIIDEVLEGLCGCISPLVVVSKVDVDVRVSIDRRRANDATVRETHQILHRRRKFSMI